jgi:branched-chain amino acid transport system permease protein
MTLSQLAQMFVNGSMIGFQLALFATGLTLVYGIMHIVNFAHGELYMLGGYGVFFFGTQLGMNFYVALLLSMIVVGLLSVGIERVFFKPLRGQSKHIPSFVMSCGLILILQTVAVLIFGPKDKAVSSPVSGVFMVGGVALPLQRLMVIGVSTMLIAAFYVYLERTRTGRAMRSIAQDPEAAALQGVSINKISALGMGIGGALAAAAGGLLAPVFVVNPYIGGTLTWTGFIVVILGGQTSLPGTLIAAFMLGYVQSFVGTLVDPVVAAMCSAALLGVVLTLRPQGLLGHV